MTEDENWLKARSMGIGGSDAGVVMGISPFKSRLQLWHEKANKKIDVDSSENLRFKLGKMLEPIIADEYTKKTGRKLEIRPIKAHPKYDFILASIDREIVGDERGPGILEMKTKGQFVDWHGEDIPMYYMMQLQQYLEVYGYSWGSFAIFDMGTQVLTVIDVDKDEKLVSDMIKEETLFWDLVKNNTPPGPDESKACERFLREHYKESYDITMDLTDDDEAIKWATALRQAKDDIKIAEIVETEAKNHLMAIMGNAERGTGGTFNITWKAPKDKEVFNLERFKIDHPKIAAKYITKEPQTRRFAVRWIN